MPGRARGRYHRDTGALRESIDGWERIGARFEHATTVQLLERARSGRYPDG